LFDVLKKRFKKMKRHPEPDWSEVFAKTDTGKSVKEICNSLIHSSFLIRIIVIFAAQP
jgi:hypothetical protein